jgi:hypothetical protein
MVTSKRNLKEFLNPIARPFGPAVAGAKRGFFYGKDGS